MDAVVATTVTSQLALALLDRLSRRVEISRAAPRSSDRERAVAATPESSEVEQSHSGENGDEPEAALPELQQRLALLRAEARSLNSPDTFVQYARVTREATMIESRIEALKAEQPSSSLSDLVGVLETQLQANGISLPLRRGGLRSILQSGMSPRVYGGGLANMAKLLVYIMTFMFLRVYFYRRGDSGCIRLNCSLLWPLAGALSRQEAGHCRADTDTCVPGNVCSISYYVFAFLCNAVVYRCLTALGLRVY